MRSVITTSCALTMALALVGCGGGGETTGTPRTSTTAASTTPTTAPAAGAEDEEYELDVIAEAEPDEGAPPLQVQFTASVEEEDGGPWKFHWDFGDGASSDEQNPSHTYQKIGEYTATLSVSDQKGNKGTDEIDIFVETEEEGGQGGGTAE